MVGFSLQLSLFRTGLSDKGSDSTPTALVLHHRAGKAGKEPQARCTASSQANCPATYRHFKPKPNKHV